MFEFAREVLVIVVALLAYDVAAFAVVWAGKRALTKYPGLRVYDPGA